MLFISNNASFIEGYIYFLMVKSLLPFNSTEDKHFCKPYSCIEFDPLTQRINIFLSYSPLTHLNLFLIQLQAWFLDRE